MVAFSNWFAVYILGFMVAYGSFAGVVAGAMTALFLENPASGVWWDALIGACAFPGMFIFMIFMSKGTVNATIRTWPCWLAAAILPAAHETYRTFRRLRIQRISNSPTTFR
jgi:hypothetical protein